MVGDRHSNAWNDTVSEPRADHNNGRVRQEALEPDGLVRARGQRAGPARRLVELHSASLLAPQLIAVRARHWTKLAVGTAPKQPPLFEPQPGVPPIRASPEIDHFRSTLGDRVRFNRFSIFRRRQISD